LAPMVLLCGVWFLGAAVYLERRRLLDAACDGRRNILVECLRITPQLKPLSMLELDRAVDRLAYALEHLFCPAWRAIAIAALAGVPAVGLLLQHPSTIDGVVGRLAVLLGAIVSLPLSALNIVTFVEVWVELRRTLRRLTLSPIASALGHLPQVNPN